MGIMTGYTLALRGEWGDNREPSRQAADSPLTNEVRMMKKRPPLYWIGFATLVLGATFTGSAIAKQYKLPPIAELHYWDWITTGLVIVIVGMYLLSLGKRQSP